MALRVVKRDDDQDALNLFSGEFRIGTVRRLQIGEALPPRFGWAITGLLVGGRTSGSAETLEKAMAAMVTRWRAWLEEAQLHEERLQPAPAVAPHENAAE